MNPLLPDPNHARTPTTAARPPATPTSPSGEVPKAPAANDNAEVVEAVLETGERSLTVGAWRFAANDDGEPMIADEDLAPRLGLALNDMRTLIRRHAKASNITPVSNRRTVRRFTSKGQDRGEIEVTGYLLTEADALFLVTRSEASGAVALTKEMIRVYLAVRRHLLAHPHARPVPPALFDRPAIRVDARIAAHPPAPVAEDPAPRVVVTYTGEGAESIEELAVLGWTFVRFGADAARAPRVHVAELAARLGVEVRQITEAVAVDYDLARLAFPRLPCADRVLWLPAVAIHATLPRLAALRLSEDGRAVLDGLADALALLDAHTASRSVYVRAHHRRPPGALRASLAVAPFTVDGVRFHILRRDGFHVAAAQEDLIAFLAARGVPVAGWPRARALLMLRSQSSSGARRCVWTDRHGEFYGLAAALALLDALMPEACPPARFDALLDAVEAIYAQAEARAAELIDAAEGAGTLDDAFAPRRLDAAVRALPA